VREAGKEMINLINSHAMKYCKLYDAEIEDKISLIVIALTHTIRSKSPMSRLRAIRFLRMDVVFAD